MHWPRPILRISPPCPQVHHILSAVTARLQQAAASHPSRLQQIAGASAAPACGAGGALSGSGPAPGISISPDDSGTSGLSLVELLQRLTEGVVGLIEGLAVEKECLESQMLHSSDEARQLRSQVGTCKAGAGCWDSVQELLLVTNILLCLAGFALPARIILVYLARFPLPQLQSMQAVLASLQSHTALEHQEALLALEQAHGQMSELQRERDELAERAAAAERQAGQLQASARQEWGAMRDELSGLVQQAEAAQLGAEATAKRQQEQFEARLAAASREAGEAAAGRAAAEAAAEELRRQLASTQQQLADAERRLGEQEAAVRGSLEASHAGVQQLEAQIASLQKQLAARVRGKGTSVEAAKKAAAASGAAALLKQENRQLRAQVEGLQEQVSGGGCVGVGNRGCRVGSAACVRADSVRAAMRAMLHLS